MKKFNLFILMIFILFSSFSYIGCNKEKKPPHKESNAKSVSFISLLPSDAREISLQTGDLDNDLIEEKVFVYYGQHSAAHAYILVNTKTGWKKLEIKNPASKYVLGEGIPNLFEIYDINFDDNKEVIFNWLTGEGSTTYVFRYNHGKVTKLLSVENSNYLAKWPILEDIDNDGKDEVFQYIGEEDDNGNVKGFKKIFTWSEKLKKYILKSSEPYTFNKSM